MSSKRKIISSTKKGRIKSHISGRKVTKKKASVRAKPKQVLLVTENPKSEFSKKVIRAAKIAKKKLIVEDAKFTTLQKILEGNIGVVVVDRDQLSGSGDHFHRAIRIFRSHTPVLMPFSTRILLENLGTQAHKRNLSASDLAKVLTKAVLQKNEMDKEIPMTYSFENDIQLHSLSDLIVRSLRFDKMLDKVNKKFHTEVEKIKHLTGDELTIALEKIRKKAFSAPEFRHLRQQIKSRVRQIRNESSYTH